MNEKVLIPRAPYDFKRIIAKVYMTIGKQSLPFFKMRLKKLKFFLGGVKIGKGCFIGSDVVFDGIYPNLIEIGDHCIITAGTHILSHFFNTQDRRFYAGKVIIGNNVLLE